MKQIYFIAGLFFLLVSYTLKENPAFAKTNHQNEEKNNFQNVSDQKNVKAALGFLKNKQYAKALILLNTLEKKNNPWSINALGFFYENGYGVKKNYKKAHAYYNRAKKLGVIESLFNLARMYQKGLGTKVNFEKALLLLKTAANSNHAPSQSNVGFIYSNGLGVIQNLKEAIRWYKLAAINGEPVAQGNLGLFYENGYGTPKNYFEAKRWYLLSAAQGDEISIESLERINSLIKKSNIKKNNSFSKILENFSDIRTMTFKRGKKISKTFVAIKTDQIQSNYITEGKVIIDNEICSSIASYNEVVNDGIIRLDCPSGYSGSGKVKPLGKNNGSRGEGEDSLGNKIQFNFHSKLKGKAEKKDMIAFFEEQKIIINTAATNLTRGFIDKNKLKKNLKKSNNFYALIISIKDYKYLNNLKTPIKDGRVIGSILEKKYGFKVDYLENAKYEEITTKLSNLVYSLRENDNFLIYFAGHGKEILGDGYWLPKDADKKNDTRWISNDYIGKKLKQIKSKNILVIADSCYSGTLTRSDTKVFTNKTKPIDEWLNTKSRMVITSGGEGPVHDIGGGGHSVFARFIINFLTNNSEAITATDLHASIYKDVSDLSLKIGTQQTPRIASLPRYGHVGPDFVFLSN